MGMLMLQKWAIYSLWIRNIIDSIYLLDQLYCFYFLHTKTTSINMEYSKAVSQTFLIQRTVYIERKSSYFVQQFKSNVLVATHQERFIVDWVSDSAVKSNFRKTRMSTGMVGHAMFRLAIFKNIKSINNRIECVLMGYVWPSKQSIYRIKCMFAKTANPNIA